MRRPGFLLGLALAALLLAPHVGRAADLRRIESVGVFPIEQGGGGPHAPRDGAVRAAVARAVEGVATEMLPEGWREAVPPPLPGEEPGEARPGDLEATFARALGPDPFEYATRFRILDDRGVRGALFTRDPEVENEYVVLVEVFVDAGRVRERLHGAGWIVAPAGQDSASQVRLVLTGLHSFGAYDALRRTLLEELEVRSVLPIELSQGRAVLAVDGPYRAETLEQALREQTQEGLRVVPLEREGQTLTLLVDWTPPPPPASPEDEAEIEPLPDALPAD